MTPATHVGAVLRGLIRLYQLSLSALFPGACRFEPTCSQYASDAITLHGPAQGSWLAIRRLCRCHPWGACGYDPVPPTVERLSCRASGPR